MDYLREHKLDTRIVRIFNTYGPRLNSNDGRVVSNFITQALSNQNITIYGDGTQTRSFQYIDDLISGMIFLMNSHYNLPVNMGNPVEINMNYLAQKILALTKSKSKIEYKELPSDDPKRRKPDISRAKEILGWSPNFKLEDGLNRTIQYFKQKNEEA